MSMGEKNGAPFLRNLKRVPGLCELSCPKFFYTPFIHNVRYRTQAASTPR